MFARERAAVEAVQNVDISDVSVYSLSRPQDECEGEHGCCDSCGIVVPDRPILMPSSVCTPESTNEGCWDTPSQVALHEFVHAALGLPEHGPAFWAALNAARRAMLN